MAYSNKRIVLGCSISRTKEIKKETEEMKETKQRKDVVKWFVVSTFGFPNAPNWGVERRMLVRNESRKYKEYVGKRTT